MCGGGGPSGETVYKWNDDIHPYWTEQLAHGKYLREKPYQQYDGQRIAGINQDQGAAMDNIRHFVHSPDQFLYGKGNQQFQDTLAGDYLSGENRNPYADQQVSTQLNPWQNASAQVPGNPMLAEPFQNPMGAASSEIYSGLNFNQNPYGQKSVDPGANKYAGDNPYFRSVLNQGLEDITGAYQKGTSADTTRMFNMAGAFGGSAHQKSVADNEAALAKQLSNYATGMQNQQYDRSAGLEENALGRGLQANTFGAGLSSQNWENALNRATGARENQINRGFGSAEADAARRFGGQESAIDRSVQNQQFDKQLGGNWYENLLQREFQGGSDAVNRGFGSFESERNRQMQAGNASQADQGLTLQRLNALMGIGDIQRGFEQDHLNQYYGDWQQQQQHPYQMSDWFSGLLSRAQGGVSTGMTQQNGGYSASPFSQLMGAGLLGYSMMR